MTNTAPPVRKKSTSVWVVAAASYSAFMVCCCCCCCCPGSEERDPAITPPSSRSYDPTLPPPLDYPAQLQCEQPSALVRSGTRGSARTLDGKQLSMLVFVDVEGVEPWTVEEKRRVTRTVERSHEWLEGEAARYGSRVQFEHVTLKDTRASRQEVARSASSSTNLRVVKRAMKQLGSDWFDEMTRQHGVDGVHLIVLPNVDGRSFAWGHYWSTSNIPDATFVYLEDREHPELQLSVIAHEVLHLYGADDLYTENPRLSAQVMGTLLPQVSDEVRRRWPKSVMLSSGRNVHYIDRYVDPFNAWMVGWTDCADADYYLHLLNSQE